MAGVFRHHSPLRFRPFSSPATSNRRRRLSFKVSSEIGDVSPLPASADARSPLSPPPGFVAPKPKPFFIRMDKFLDIVGASFGLLFRFGLGIFALRYSASLVREKDVPPDQYALKVAGGYRLRESARLGPRAEKPIEIYEFESCPFCRKVRESVSILDLDVLYYPCPRISPNFRQKILQLGGKQQFPYMVDPNTGVALYESDVIIKYLFDEYGDGKVPLMLSLGPLTTVTATLAMLFRLGKGSTYRPSRQPSMPLELWAYEASPFCKVVREVLVELELPHLLHSTARGSPKRQELYEKVGHFQAPYLEDPNTGVQMFESAEIIDYLRAIYALQ